MNKRYYSYNRTHPLAHQYALGEALQQQWQAPDWNNVKLGGLASGAVGVVGGLINPKGNTSKAGNFISGAGDVVSMINPLWGAAVKGVGMLTNAAFGSNVNTEAVNGLNSDLLSARDSVGNALTWDTLSDSIRDLGNIDVEGANLGSQGWFSHAVDKERDKLRAREEQARGALAYATSNINTLQNRQAMGTLLADGGGIHIKPSKRGTFTAQATKMGMGVQEAARHILANKEDYSPAMRKKAAFAKAAAGWKHDEGGPIFKTAYDMGLTFINAGGTHEQNPYGGVFMGIAPDGQPNQVEEGEIIFNDYVYSNRLRVPKAVRNKYRLRDKRELSFADAMEDYIKKNGIEERNNDPIANRGIEAFASELAMEQEMIKAKKEMRKLKNSFAAGGSLIGGHKFDGETGSSTINRPWIGYDKTKETPFFDTLYSQDSDYMKALNWLRDPINADARHQLQDAITRGDYDDPNGPRRINGVTINDSNWWNLATDGKFGPVHNAFMQWTENNRDKWGATPLAPVTPNISGVSINPEVGGVTHGVHSIGPNGTEDTLMYSSYNDGLANPSQEEGVAKNTEERNTEYDPSYWWRMAGLGANAAGLMYNIFDPYRPKAVNEARYTTMNPKYIGDYMAYNPYDINYAISQQDANSAATMNALMQSSAPIRNASLLANDFNNNATRGATRRQALEYNDSLRKAVTDFNRATNQFNAQMYVDAATKNQAAKQAYFQDRLRQAQFNSQLDFQHKMMRDQAIGQGLTAIGDYLNDIGRENIARAGAEVYASTMPIRNKEAEEYTGLVSRRRPKKTTKSKKGE